ncbi:MAG: HEPN domain-containing protein [Myxococcota bacterium]|nr:HEPN domain-containing protein [Myxococcota bacterium]
MTKREQAPRRLRDAWDARDTARDAVASGKARNACMNAQLAVEMAAKAIIAQFAEPQWTHRPSPQLRDLLLLDDRALEAFLGPAARADLLRLAGDVDAAAEWHGWSTYGRKLQDGTYQAAVDVCTIDAARDLLARAEHAVALASRACAADDR